MLRRFCVAALVLLLAVVAVRASTYELYQVPLFINLPAEGALALPDDIVINDVPGNGPPFVADPVVPTTGEFFTARIDLRGHGLIPLVFGRHYGSFMGQAASFWGFYPTFDSPMGANWVHNHQLLLMRISDHEAAVYYARGQVVFFEKTGGVWAMAPAPVGFVYMGTPYQMVESGSRLEMLDPRHRLILTFEFLALADGEVGGVEEVRDRNGNAHHYAYNADGTLARVDDGLGRSLDFTYVAAGGAQRIESVTDEGGRVVAFTYSQGGQLRRATSARGHKTVFTYDSNAKLLTLAQPEGNVPVTNTYAASGKCDGQADGEGNVWDLAYGNGRTTVTDPLGNQRIHEFDGALRLTRWTDEAGRSATMAYDAELRLLSTTDRLGATSSITYHAPSGRVATRTDAAGETWTWTYAPQVQEGFTFHDLVRLDHPDGAFETFTRDARGNVVAYTDRRGHAWTCTYDASGRVLAVVNPKGGVEAFTYDALGNRVSRTDPEGNVTAYVRDAHSRVSQVTRPDGTTVQFAYDANDNLLSVTDEAGAVQAWTWDKNDNLVSATDPLGQTTTFAYDGNDDLLTATDRNGAAVTLAYDGLRQVVARTDRAGGVTQFVRDARRRLASVIDPGGRVTAFAYDDEGVRTSVIDAGGATTSFESDLLGRVTRTVDPLGNATEFQYDALGRRTRTTDPLGEVTQVRFDAAGEAAGIALPEPGTSVRCARDELGGVRRVDDPRGGSWRSRFDDLGRRVQELDPLGNLTLFEHDARSRLERITFAGGLGFVDVTMDAASRLARLAYSDGTDLGFGYDAAGRLAAAEGIALAYDAEGRITDCNGIALLHDAEGRLLSATLAPGRTLTWTYDARGFVRSVTDWVGGTTRLAYDDAGRVVRLERPNGTVTRHAYDAAGRLVSIGDGALAQLAFTRDARGQVVSLTRAVPLAATPPLSDRGFAFDGACQDVAVAYDALGRVLDDGARAFTWDLASRLARIDDGGTVIRFTHDAAGLPITRDDGATVRELVWNWGLGLPSLAIVREGGQDLRYYVHLPGGLLLHSIEAASGARRFHHFDQVGSTQFLTDDAGAVTDAYCYSPYGEVLARSGSSDNPFTWHGQLGVIAEAGLYQMRARWYDPVAMRFLSRDPVRGTDPARINPYQALFGDPIGLIDPLGTDPVAGRAIAGGLFGATARAKAGPIVFERCGPEDPADYDRCMREPEPDFRPPPDAGPRQIIENPNRTVIDASREMARQTLDDMARTPLGFPPEEQPRVATPAPGSQPDPSGASAAAADGAAAGQRSAGSGANAAAGATPPAAGARPGAIFFDEPDLAGPELEAAIDGMFPPPVGPMPYFENPNRPVVGSGRLPRSGRQMSAGAPPPSDGPCKLLRMQ